VTVLWLLSSCCWWVVVGRLGGADSILLARCGRSAKEGDLGQSLGTARSWLQEAAGCHGEETDSGPWRACGVSSWVPCSGGCKHIRGDVPWAWWLHVPSFPDEV